MNHRSGFWENRKVFLTGATGFLGGWLTRLLLERGAQVVALTRSKAPNDPVFPFEPGGRLHLLYGKLEDYGSFAHALQEHEVETVLHTGAQAIVGLASRDPRPTFETNIQGTWNVLEACRVTPTVRQIVVASSDKAYGNQTQMPLSEDSALLADTPYEVSKACTDILAKAYFNAYRLPVCITRCANFFGGGDLHFNRIVPSAIRSTLQGVPLEIRSDGTLVRDYFYIENAAAAYLVLAERMQDSSLHGHAFNFTEENPMTVLEIVGKILSAMGRSDLKPKILNRPHNEIQIQYLTAQKARRMLQWQPLIRFEESLKRTIHWYREYFER